MNSKKNRPKLGIVSKRREQERRQMRKLLKELKMECYAQSIQLEIPFVYEREAPNEGGKNFQDNRPAKTFFRAVGPLNEIGKIAAVRLANSR